MAFLPGLKSLWNAIKTVILVILVVIILIVAWEAILVAFEYGAVQYTWMGSLGSAFVVAGQWAAANPWLFALASVCAIAVIDPDVAADVVAAFGRVATEVLETALDVVTDVIQAVWPNWLTYALVGYAGYKLVSGLKSEPPPKKESA